MSIQFSEMKKIALLLIQVFFVFVSFGQLYFPPNNSSEWQTLTPASQGWCEDELDTLLQFLDVTNSKAFIVLKDGKIVVEEYFDSFTQDSLWQWASAGKTVTSFLTGIAQQQGLLDIQDTSANYIGNSWTSCLPEDEAAITIRHQLTMTTGLDDDVEDLDCTDPECLVCEELPGTYWSYHNAPYTLLDQVLEGATGQSFNGYFFSELRNPIGMNGAFLPFGYLNVLFTNARSMARFGLLMHAGGNWNGTPIMTDTEYFNEMITPSQNINQAYGYLWWLNGQSSFMIPQSQFVFPGMLSPAAPAEMICAIGKDGQIINVVPSQGLVVIRMGENDGNSLVPITYQNEIWEYLNQVFCDANQVELAKENKMNVWPNPAADMLYLSAPLSNETIKIYAVSGKVVLVVTGSMNASGIDIRSLTPGIYHCVVEGGNRHQTTFIKQ